VPRGQFWEMTFDPDWDGPAVDASLANLDGSSGLVRRRVVEPDGKPVSVTWSTKGPERIFTDCDISAAVAHSRISNCTFLRCRFTGSTWESVKFSRCTFQQCDFTDVLFSRCYFVRDCVFMENSAYPELFRIQDTAVSATAFIRGLSTNLRYAPNGVYQRHRFVRARQKIAKALFSSTRSEAEVDYFFEAYEQLTRCTVDEEIERHRFDHQERPRPLWLFALRSSPKRFERRILLTSGWLTNWGRSLVRPIGFFVATVAFFGVLYLHFDPLLTSAGWRRVIGGLIEASNVTLVAGYTAYFDGRARFLLQVIREANVVLGLFWYSLLVPVLSRRILR